MPFNAPFLGWDISVLRSYSCLNLGNATQLFAQGIYHSALPDGKKEKDNFFIQWSVRFLVTPPDRLLHSSWHCVIIILQNNSLSEWDIGYLGHVKKQKESQSECSRYPFKSQNYTISKCGTWALAMQDPWAKRTKIGHSVPTRKSPNSQSRPV